MPETKKSKKIMFPKSRIMNSKQLIDLIKESSENNVRFCFILGSGASISSQIPTGRELEKSWMKCLMGEEDDMGSPKRDKETVRQLAKNLYKEKKIDHNFDEIIKIWETEHELSSEYYFDIYRLRFHPDSHNGDRYLERLMEGKEPSLGYYILSIFMEAFPQNNLIITTNFDSLMEDALYLFSTKRPFVAGHESLARYISSDVQRPIIAKVHRSLFCEPFNSPQTTSSLSQEWRDALDYAFKTYVPIVIGYGGGDGSLMSFLEEESTRMRHGIYWCCVGEGCKQDLRIQELVRQKDGCFVEISGFDQLMLEIGNTLFPGRIKPAELEKHWKEQADKRVNSYLEQMEAIRKEPSANEIIEQIDKEDIEEEHKREEEGSLTYWDYYNRARRAENAEKYDEALSAYTQAINKRPDQVLAYLSRGYLYEKQEKYEEAEKDYNISIELDPQMVSGYKLRAILYNKLGRYEEALRDMTTAIALNPDDVSLLQFRSLLYMKIGEYDVAINDARKAIKLSPNDADSYYHLGLLYSKQEKWDNALQMFSMSIEKEPNFKEAYLMRAEVYRALGNEKSAKEDEKIAETLA